MKKIISLFAAIILLSFIDTPKERTYTIVIPEHLINAYWHVVHGGEDNITVKDYKEVLPLIQNQIQKQVKEYHIIDSASATKKDTTHK